MNEDDRPIKISGSDQQLVAGGLKMAQAGERTGQLSRPRPRLRPGRGDCSGGWAAGLLQWAAQDCWQAKPAGPGAAGQARALLGCLGRAPVTRAFEPNMKKRNFILFFSEAILYEFDEYLNEFE
jgi:hypothetical protein